MIKSPLRYPGGKSRAVKQISTLIPEFIEYREPFVGGGSVFVYLKQKYPNKQYWINDIYNLLYHFWLACRDNMEDLIAQIYKWRKEFEEGKRLHRFLLDNVQNFDHIQKGATFFVINRISFSGTSESGGFSNAAFQKRFTESSIERVVTLSSLLSNTSITNWDYEPVVKTPGKDVFMFLDPPYYSAKSSALYGKNGKLHKDFDHERFASVMRNVEHKWLITYDDNDYIRELFAYANIKSWDIMYGMRNVGIASNQNAKELFIANFDIDMILNEQLTIFQNIR